MGGIAMNGRGWNQGLGKAEKFVEGLGGTTEGGGTGGEGSWVLEITEG